jgi:hypothetical protein
MLLDQRVAQEGPNLNFLDLRRRYEAGDDLAGIRWAHPGVRYGRPGIGKAQE